MKLEFDNLHELQEFMTFAGFQRGEPAQAPLEYKITTLRADVELSGLSGKSAEDVARERGVYLTPEEEAAALRKFVADGAAKGGTLVGAIDSVAAEIEAEKPKRTRRTRGQIAVEEAAAQLLREDGSFSETEQGPAETAPAANADASAGEKATDPAAFIAAALLVTPEVKQTDHLNYARGFIQKFGMAKYNETQTLAGLGGNVMAYAPKDCAAHMAAMQFVEQS